MNKKPMTDEALDQMLDEVSKTTVKKTFFYSDKRPLSYPSFYKKTLSVASAVIALMLTASTVIYMMNTGHHKKIATLPESDTTASDSVSSYINSEPEAVIEVSSDTQEISAVSSSSSKSTPSSSNTSSQSTTSSRNSTSSTQSSAPSNSVKTVKLENSSLVQYHNGYIYFAECVSGKKSLYRAKPDGSGKAFVTDLPSCNIAYGGTVKLHFSGKYLYISTSSYLSFVNPDQLYRMNPDGSDTVTLTTSITKILCFSDEWLYVADGLDLLRTNDGKTGYPAQAQVESGIVFGDYLYFNMYQSFHRIKKDFSDEPSLIGRVSEHPEPSTIVHADSTHLYYVYNSELFSLKLDGGNHKSLYKYVDSEKIYGTYGDYLYYDNNGTLKRIKPDGTGGGTIAENAKYVSFINNSIYYITANLPNLPLSGSLKPFDKTLYKCDLDGKNKQIIKSEKDSLLWLGVSMEASDLRLYTSDFHTD